MANNISEGRKTAYYIGGGMIVVGFLCFFSVFITGALTFGDFTKLQANTQSSIFRGVGGMGLIIIGAIIRGIGARGLAGSGVILDPKKARSELEPYSRMTGGMVKDALDEAKINLSGGSGKSEQVIMLKCRECGKLNEEDSKFCQECGKPI